MTLLAFFRSLPPRRWLVVSRSADAISVRKIQNAHHRADDWLALLNYRTAGTGYKTWHVAAMRCKESRIFCISLTSAF
jgi:hypothetical protein